MSDWWFYERTERLPAKDGIKARSQRGEIGESWWSQRFIAVLKEISDPNRLGRGRSYARSGQVMDLEIRAGEVRARVQGSRPAPYKVRIAVEPLSGEQWEAVEAEMARQAIFMAALLAGEMPRDIEEAFTGAGLSLFPERSDALDTSCSCPDWANPCKHVAAALYILAEKLDEDPFLIFAWRGRGKEELIARLRERRGAALPDSGADAFEEEIPDGTPPLAESLQDFWHAGAELRELRISPRAAEMPDALLRQLGPLPLEVRGRAVHELLAEAYRTAAAAAERRAFAPGGDAPAERSSAPGA